MKTTIEKRAVKLYGTTVSVFNAGYMLQDGTMLDFSEGGGEGRCIDHRNISYFYNYDKYEYGVLTKQMLKFMARGNIRIMPESASIEFTIKPTKDQLYIIREISKDFRRIGRELTIEKSKGNHSDIIGNYQDLLMWIIEN